MHEIEIKFQIDPARRGDVAAEVAGPEASPSIHLQAAYFDSADRALARARIALRVRREGDRWVQTLKGAADDGMTRFEHNVDLAELPGAAPLADPALHADTEIGHRLMRVIAASAGDLVCLYRTDVSRRTRRVDHRSGTVEIAFDEGRISAGDASLDLCEVEFELVDGSPLAVIETARDWVTRHGLTLDTRSKSERGDMLARAERRAPPRRGQPVTRSDSMSAAECRIAFMRACLDQISVNASQVASAEFEAAHVHELQVGLRRLRRATRGPDVSECASLQSAAALLLRRLSRPDAQPHAVVRDIAAQSLLLDLLTAAQAATN